MTDTDKTTVCATCGGERRILHIYARGPNDPPGNAYVPCPDCQHSKSTLPARLADALKDIAVWQSTGNGFLCRSPRPRFQWRRKSMQKLAALGLVERQPHFGSEKFPSWEITDAGWETYKNG